MQLVIATVEIEESAVDTARTALTTLAQESRGDTGCLSYEFHQSTESPTTFRSIETWASAEDLDAHMGQPHVASAIEQLTPHLTAELDIASYGVDG